VALLPEHLPDLDNIDVAVAYLPASEHAVVGGDWYDVIPLARERVGLIVGDVAGHGPAAATAMAQLRNALRAFATHIADPGDALGAFSDYMCKQLPEHMATVVYVVVDQAAGRLQYANAGHPPPLLRRDGGRDYLQDVLGPPAGVLPGHTYTTATVALDGRTRLVCYTDGLIERRGEPIDSGLRRLEGVAADGAGNAHTCCSAVLKALIGQAELDDDAVALVADVHPAGGQDASGRREELASSP
jgi:serine phosphatase RsbU (regulator of sigma subunit)